IAFEKGQNVQVSVVTHPIELECYLLLANRLCLGQAVEPQECASQNPVTESAIGIQAHGFLRLHQSLVKLADLVIVNPEIVGGNGVSRIGPFPELIGLDRLVQFSRDVVVIMSGDVELLPFTGPFSSLECQLGTLGSPLSLTGIAIGLSQPGVSYGEIWIQF